MKTYSTHAEYLADCSDVRRHRGGSIACYTPPARPYRWTCADCGAVFPDSESFATAGESAICYECAAARDREALRDRSRPFTGYLSGDGRTFATWAGKPLGAVIESRTVNLPRWSPVHGRTVRAVTIRDVHGGLWYGRSSPGVCITIRPKRG